MNANFFSQIAKMDITGDLHLIISKGADDTLIVSTQLNNEHCGDDAKNCIVPLNLKGTAAELDEGYFERIAAPIEKASGLMVNMEAFLKQLEEAQKQSAMEKEKAEKERRDKEARDKKYKEEMAKADELEKEGKHREAWMKVPDPTEYPDHAEAIRKRKSQLSDKFASPSLFGAE
ncbi:MAG: PRTRC system protein E [Terrimonas ferruginea]|uniref:PRTRC system protein E n=1 Tax=Terrimonas ferruginea TaxID=249 RepID=UPI00092895A5|nr:PRTRC system protein E [Terrimonas ferruginea]MBN8784284.1 PRTRC system protein E [Terrimonas ferruginea]MBX3242243.1 PRTRC system protein E [Chitinophagaceae bacterium]MCW5928171.1 PRTRC system protein E [Chitinophagaceae bacterium]OJW45729.1 MAG: prtrc system protein e [Sphingobacteriales bacterium 48-107]